MKAQISLELLISLSLAFALMLYAAGLWLGLAPRASSIQANASSHLSSLANLTQSVAAQYGCFESNMVVR